MGPAAAAAGAVVVVTTAAGIAAAHTAGKPCFHKYARVSHGTRYIICTFAMKYGAAKQIEPVATGHKVTLAKPNTAAAS